MASISVLKARAARAARFSGALERAIIKDVIADGGGDTALIEAMQAIESTALVAELETRLGAVDDAVESARAARRAESAPSPKVDALRVRLGLARLGA